MALLSAFEGALAQGVLWSIMALGVYITFRILDIADLTVDGSFATGGAICAVLIISGVHPLIAVCAGTLAGCIAGFITGLLITKCHIPAILSGILTQIGLYSINLRIMGDKSNIPLLSAKSIFDWIRNLGLRDSYAIIFVGLIFVIIIIAGLYWFFGTEIGSAIRATGNNEQMVRAVGVNTNTTKLIGVTLSNGLIAMSGALVAQSQGSSDVKMGIGAIVIALASIVIGEVIFSKITKGYFLLRLVSIVIGSIIYRVVIAFVLQMGLSTNDLKLLTAIIVGIALTIPVVLSHRHQMANYKKLTQEVDAKNASN